VFDETPGTPWWEPYWELADALVESIDEPMTLTALLERADLIAADLAADGEDIDAASLAAVVCHVVHEHFGTKLLGHDTATRVVCVVPTADHLCHPAVEGRDLLVVPAEVDPSVENHGALSPGKGTA
jgi:hypothetical protein